MANILIFKRFFDFIVNATIILNPSFSHPRAGGDPALKDIIFRKKNVNIILKQQ